ncbi:MAG: hypothetical protein KAT10_03520 [Sulfurimonas sp.]|nr:hypothetical protein [Sulfurimonas sp.]
MYTSYDLSTYRTHDLNISMRTSSGDVIEMDFSNAQSSSFSHEQDENGSKTSMSFSSMQSFQFSMDSNGIDEQDKKEIKAFMKIAQPFIDDFLKELKEDTPSSPVSKVAHQIAGAFEPNRGRSEEAKNHVKTNIVEMFDNSMKKLDIPDNSEKVNTLDKIFADAKKLLERTLKEFDKFNQNIYA